MVKELVGQITNNALENYNNQLRNRVRDNCTEERQEVIIESTCQKKK